MSASTINQRLEQRGAAEKTLALHLKELERKILWLSTWTIHHADRLEREDITVMAYRFAGDRFCRAERFAAYAEALGARFVGRVLPDSAANTDVPPFFAERVTCPHSVVTVHLIDEAGQPTIVARDEILSLFRATSRFTGLKPEPAHAGNVDRLSPALLSGVGEQL